MREIDGRGLGFQGLEAAARVVVAFFEGGEGGGGAAFEAEGGGEVGPVDFGGGGTLVVGGWGVSEVLGIGETVKGGGGATYSGCHCDGLWWLQLGKGFVSVELAASFVGLTRDLESWHSSANHGYQSTSIHLGY